LELGERPAPDVVAAMESFFSSLKTERTARNMSPMEFERQS
jgi:hypothetical protein